MTDIATRLREAALAFRSQFNGENEPLAALIEDAAEQIDLLTEAETRWISRIYDMRKALGTEAIQAMLHDLPAEVSRVRAADRRAGMTRAAEIAERRAKSLRKWAETCRPPFSTVNEAEAQMNERAAFAIEQLTAAIRAEAEKGERE